MAKDIIESYLRDSVKFLSTLRSFSTEEEKPGIDALARALHSLKSGSSFLGWHDVETVIHDLEDTLDKESVDWAHHADTIENLISHHHKTSLSEKRLTQFSGRAILFDEFERRVLEESQLRGEHFYRLSCTIDPAEPMPFSRAYLLASRIETGMTLIKSEPPMDQSEEDFYHPTFWFSTEEPESKIFRLANIDLVHVAELIQLEYEDVLMGDDSSQENAQDDAQEDIRLIMDQPRYMEVMALAEELSWRLEKQPGTEESMIANELQRNLESLAFRPLEPLLRDLKEAADRLAQRRGVKIRFEWEIASGGLDAGTRESLGEILLQLMRNSIRHGIEKPSERVKSDKDESGVIFLKVLRSGHSYQFRYSDDGRGIDEKSLRAKAEHEGLLDGQEEMDLQKILCQNGFSTLDESDLDGGRGFGLDVVRSTVQREFGSELHFVNTPGEGLSILWTLPEMCMRRPYLVFASAGKTWAIPSGSVYQRGLVDRKSIDASGQGYRIGGGLLPIIGPEGLLPPGESASYYLEIRHRNRRALLFIDDLVTEEPWGLNELIASDPVGPWGRALKDAKNGIPILSPALVYAADTLTDV